MSMLFGVDPVSKAMVPLGAAIDQTAPDRVRVRTAPGYTTAVFQNRQRNLEILITSPNGEHTWKVLLVPPETDQTITIAHGVDGYLDIRYERL